MILFKLYNASIQKYGTIYSQRFFHTKPRPVTPREAWTVNKKQRKSLKWTKPILEYDSKRKQQQQEDSDKEPHMIHVVKRVKTMSGRPWWEKDICKEFGLDKKMHQAVPLKNVPSVNKKLKEIKHLVQIHPLQFPHGLPDDESDHEYSELRSDGSLRIRKKIQGHELNSSETDEPVPRRNQLTRTTIQKELEKIKKRYEVYKEYYKAQYTYLHNQDGKEYRYTKYPYYKKVE